MDENQEVIKLATAVTLVEVGKRVLMNLGDDMPVPYRQEYEGQMSTGDWVAEQFGAALQKAFADQKALEGL
ncbi:MAG: hypothetical protein EOM43_19195 [Gammaproteobacteria bacterium]|nr:hypothetical protein [Gammaproteobacteria bacterium]